MSYQQFLRTLPPRMIAQLPAQISVRSHQPFRWIVQFYDQDRQIHYEVQRIPKRHQFELGLHFESRNKALNAHLLQGFSRRAFEIHDQLGASIAVEPWDRGWAKVYDLISAEPLTEAFQARVVDRLAEMITCLHPILHHIYEEPLARPKSQIQRNGRKITSKRPQNQQQPLG